MTINIALVDMLVLLLSPASSASPHQKPLLETPTNP